MGRVERSRRKGMWVFGGGVDVWLWLGGWRVVVLKISRTSSSGRTSTNPLSPGREERGLWRREIPLLALSCLLAEGVEIVW